MFPAIKKVPYMLNYIRKILSLVDKAHLANGLYILKTIMDGLA